MSCNCNCKVPWRRSGFSTSLRNSSGGSFSPIVDKNLPAFPPRPKIQESPFSRFYPLLSSTLLIIQIILSGCPPAFPFLSLGPLFLLSLSSIFLSLFYLSYTSLQLSAILGGPNQQEIFIRNTSYRVFRKGLPCPPWDLPVPKNCNDDKGFFPQDRNFFFLSFSFVSLFSFSYPRENHPLFHPPPLFS